MKFSLDRKIFLETLTTVSRAITNKTNLPALTGVLISCKDQKVTMITSNNEFSIKAELVDDSLTIEENGTCLIPGKFFGEFVRKANGDFIVLTVYQDNILKVESGTTEMTLNLLDVEDYPVPTFSSVVNPICIKGKMLKEIIKQTTFAASPIDTKPILTGVNFKISTKKLLTVATDSFRLSKKETEIDNIYDDINIIIQARTLEELSKVIFSDSEEVKLYLSNNKALFECGKISFQTRLIEGNYPDTARLIPTNLPISYQFNKEELINSIDRVSTLSNNPNMTTVVRLDISQENICQLSCSTPELGTIKDEILPTKIISSEELHVSFSATYILDALRAFESEKVYLKFTNNIKPFILEADQDEGVVELVLPMKAD